MPAPALVFDSGEIEALQRAYDPRIVERAVGAGINRSAAKGRTQVSKGIRERYMITAGDISRRLTIRRARLKGGRHELVYRGRRVGLINFGAREVRGVGVVAKRGRDGRFTGGYEDAGLAETRYRGSGKRLSGSSRRRADTDRSRRQVGISVQVRRGRRKIIQATVDGRLPFIAQGNNGLPHIFRRLGRASLPLQRLETLAVPQMVEAIQGHNVVSQVVAREFPVEFGRAMDHFMEQAK